MKVIFTPYRTADDGVPPGIRLFHEHMHQKFGKPWHAVVLHGCPQ